MQYKQNNVMQHYVNSKHLQTEKSKQGKTVCSLSPRFWLIWEDCKSIHKWSVWYSIIAVTKLIYVVAGF